MDDIYVGRVMTSDPLTIAPDASVAAAAETMLDHDVGSLLVTDEGRLVGILTTTDFVSAVAADGAGHDATVESQMTAEVVTVGAQEPIADAADRLIEGGIHHLPVVDDEDGLVGILSTTDLTGYLSHVQSPSPS